MNYVEKRRIPDMEHAPGCRGWFYGQCPACGHRFWNSHWNAFFYPLHYAEIHLEVQAFRRPRKYLEGGN